MNHHVSVEEHNGQQIVNKASEKVRNISSFILSFFGASFDAMIRGHCSYPGCKWPDIPLTRLCKVCGATSHHLCQIAFEEKNGLDDESTPYRHIHRVNRPPSSPIIENHDGTRAQALDGDEDEIRQVHDWMLMQDLADQGSLSDEEEEEEDMPDRVDLVSHYEESDDEDHNPTQR